MPKISRKMTDYTYMARSEEFVNPADGTYNVIPVPRWAMVEDVFLDVYDDDVNGTVTVGFSGNGAAADPDGFIDATLGVTSAVGMIRAFDDAQPGSKGKWFANGTGMITVTTSGVDAGSFRVFIKYSIIH